MRLTPAEDTCTPSLAATALVVWRLAVAAVALVGFCLAMLNGTRRWHWVGLYEWSQLTTLFACLVALGAVAAPALRPGEATLAIFRGAACAYVLLTMIGYRFLIGGDYSLPASLLEHLVVPLLVLVDWVFVGRRQASVKWWWSLMWIVGPAAYVGLYIRGAQQYGVSPYPTFTVGSATFWPNVTILFASFLPIFFAVLGAPRLIRITRGPAAARQAQSQRV